MFKESMKAHQFYHVSLFGKRFRTLYLAELTMNFCIGYYLCYKQIALSSFFIFVIPIVVFVGLLMYSLNTVQALSVPEKAPIQLYRMIPNSFLTFEKAMNSTFVMVVIFSSFACIANILMTQDISYVVPYVCIYSMWIVSCVVNLYVTLTRNKYTFVISWFVAMVAFSSFMALFSIKSQSFNMDQIAVMMLYVTGCILLSYFLLKKAIKFMKGVWLQ